MKWRILGSLIAVLVLCLAAGVVSAEVVHDEFMGMISFGSVVGDGTGYGDGWFYEYPSGWHNQWFYNDDFDATRYKVIDYVFEVTQVDFIGDTPIEIAINWSSDAWPNGTGAPPLPGDDEGLMIVRQEIYNDVIFAPITLEGQIIVEDYNPEWVSIDIRSQYAVDGSDFWFKGTIDHECIPEPASMGLVALGLAGMIMRRKRR